MKVTVAHCEAGHTADVEVTTDTGAVVRVLVENAWAEDGHPAKAAVVELDVNGHNVGAYTGI